MAGLSDVVADRSRFRKPAISALLCVVVLGSGLWGFGALASLKQQPPRRETVAKVFNVEVFDVERTELQETVVGYGTAIADREVIVSAQVEGEIVELHPRLHVGESMTAAGIVRDAAGRSQPFPGDLLLKIDPESFQQKLSQAESRLAEDKADRRLLEQQALNTARHLEKANEDYRLYAEEVSRIDALRRQKIKADSDLTAARLELQRYREAQITLENERVLYAIRHEQLDRRIAVHELDISLLKRDLEHTVVRPPFAGTLSETMVDLGQHVRVGDPLVKLIDVGLVDVPVSLPLGDYAKIAAQLGLGKQPPVELAEHETGAARWLGHVVRVAPQADPLTRTVKVFVRVENAQQPVPLLPGTFVHARITGPLLKDVLVIPRDCLVDRHVFVVRDGHAVQQDVEVQETVRAFAVIRAGLAPGDRVIMTNLDLLHESASVREQSRRNLQQEIQQRNPWKS